MIAMPSSLKRYRALEETAMDMRQLSYFVAIVEEGTFSAAARRLHVSQPPLSQQIKLLEQELGVSLMERGARKITLTDAGRLLYQRAQHILELTQTTVRELEDLERGLAGTLRLGTVSTSGCALLSSRMLRYHLQYPKVRFEIHEKNTYELIELLKIGVIDAAIVRTPFNAEPFDCVYLDEEPMCAAMCPQHNWTAEQSISLSELAGRPLTIYRRFENLLCAQCNDAGFEPDILCKSDDARTAIMWADAGLGVAIVPQSALSILPGKHLVHKTIECPALVTRIAAIRMKNRFLPAAAQSLLQCFEQE